MDLVRVWFDAGLIYQLSEELDVGSVEFTLLLTKCEACFTDSCEDCCQPLVVFALRLPIPYSRENNDRLFYSKIAHLCGTDYVG